MSKKKGAEESLPLTNYYAIDAEGNRFGLASCLLCGASIIIDCDGSVVRHFEWHKKQRGA